MRKWIIAILAIVAAIIIGFAVSAYIAFSPFLGMMEEIDEINSTDMDAVVSGVMQHPAAVAFTDRYPSNYIETENLGVGGINTIIISNDGSQLTIEQDTDGMITNVVYICFYPDGLSSDSADGPDVAERIPTMC